MYSKNQIPIIPTNQILFKVKSGGIMPSFGSVNTSTNLIDSTYFITQDIDNANIFDIANQYYESGNAVWCHPNFWAPFDKTTNDPLYTNQYYLRNTGQNGGIAGIDINVFRVWNMTKGNATLRVAVIDEGVEEHEDLPARFCYINCDNNK